MNYNTFIESKTITHSNTIDNFDDGILFLIESGYDIISYKKCIELSFLNVDMLEYEKNKYVYKYEVKKDVDVINNIILQSTTNDIQMKIIIGNNEYDYTSDTFLLAAMPYSKFRLKFMFSEKPTINDNIIITYTCYLLQNNMRRTIISNKITTNDYTYANGMCIKI